jgi:hypothetical protein
MSWLSSFLHPERGYDAAQGQLDKYYNQGQGYLQPYNQNGQETYGKYSGAMDKLLNPTALQDEWTKSYQESEAAKQAEAQASQSGLNAAQQMGLGGSTPALQAIQGGTAGIVAKDRQQYLDDLMKKYMTGIGIGSDIYNTGAGAANTQSQNAGRMGENSAGVQFGKTNAPGETFGKGVGMISKLIEQYMTGGFGQGSFGRGSWSPTGG